MTLFITGNTTPVSVGSEPVFISPTGSLSGTTGIVFGASSNPGRAILAGVVNAGNVGASLNGDDRLTIASTGIVFAGATGGDGIIVGGIGNSVTVAGLVSAPDFGIYTQPASLGTLITITETGVVEGGSNGDGEDGGNFSAAIGNLGSFATIVNHGEIIGQSNPDNGSATIAIADAGAGSSSGFNPNTSNALIVFNSGSIRGDVLMFAGNDRYSGRNDGVVFGTIDLGAGDDTAAGAASQDTIEGGSGDDTIYGGGSGDDLSGGAGNDTINGADGDDLLSGGAQNDVLIGGRGEDTLDGDNGNDVLRGSAGDDVLNGGQGGDALFGGADDDVLLGLGGRDELNGGTGNDVLSGLGDFDTFIFNNGFGHDIITDFNLSNSEKIDVSGVVGIINPADLFANHLTQDGADVIFDDLLGNTITIENTRLGNLDNGDFILN